MGDVGSQASHQCRQGCSEPVGARQREGYHPRRDTLMHGFRGAGHGFFAHPSLGLRSSTRKVGVNFMGCFGAFSAMYVAKQIVEADKTGRAVVLIACAETCSNHMALEARMELLVGNTIFADGAAAAIITHPDFRGHARRPGAPDAGVPLSHPWVIGDLSSEIVPNSAGSMTWRAGPLPAQYDMWLDRSIPSALSSMFTTHGLSMLARVGIPSAYSCAWAIHPGGKAIIKAFSEALTTLRIKPDGLQASTDVLSNYGNMSSPTILFVLQRVLSSTTRDDVFTAGFGPGLTIEFGRLTRWTGAASGPAAEANAEAAAPALSNDRAEVSPDVPTVVTAGKDDDDASESSADSSNHTPSSTSTVE